VSDFKTFDEWSRLGYKINKGAKASREGDKNYFTRNQVTYSPKRVSCNATFHGCAPKGTAQIWDLDLEEEEDYGDNPLHNDWMGRW
jgi:hypothetical protein